MKRPKLSSQAQFKQLRSKWYAKLKSSGFNDIEYDDIELKQYSEEINKPKYLGRVVAKQEYYYQATHFLNTYQFESNLEKVIWEYHSNGISVRNISKLLKMAKVSTLSYQGVFNRIKRVRIEMKRYLLKQAEIK